MTLPCPGTVIVSGAGVSSKSAGGPATLSFRIAARGAKKRILAQRGAIRLKLSVAFIPIGGERNAQSTIVRLRKSE